MQTRTGNTESPDSTWSDWSVGYRVSTGDRITSPPARFIQLRAKLRSAAPGGGASGSGASNARLRTIAIAYLPRNQAPDIGAITVLPAGVALQDVPLALDPSIMSSGLDPQVFGVVASVPPRRFYQKGARTLTWQASDPNGDTLTYKVLYRSIADSAWHVLSESQPQAYYTVDGNRLPDGSYAFRVIGSDSADNPAEASLTDEESIEPVEIDNTPPAIKTSEPKPSANSVEVTFEAVDSTSRVIKGEFSVDGGPWQLVFPMDGLADSSRETFRVVVKMDRPGEHVIAFRCGDSSLNVATAKATFVK
jgi:hypothetical protein